MIKRLVGLGVVFAALASPASGSAAVTIGSDLEGTPHSAGCDVIQLCTLVQTQLTVDDRASGGLTAPSDGVVTRFRVKSGANSTAPVFLRVIRQSAGPGLTATGAGTSAGFVPPANAISPSFPVRLPIQANDRIGLNCCLGATNDIEANGGTGDSVAIWGISGAGGAPLGDGDTPRDQDTNDQEVLLLQADIEPDADRDNFGDETQDLCPTNAAIQAACPLAATTPPAPTGKRKRCKKKRSASSAKKKKKCRKKRRK